MSVVKNVPSNVGDVRDAVQPLGREDSLEEGMATHFSILAWKIPWTEESGGLWSIASKIVGHDWSDLACTFIYGKIITTTRLVNIHYHT